MALTSIFLTGLPPSLLILPFVPIALAFSFALLSYLKIRQQKKIKVHVPVLNLGDDKNYAAASQRYMHHFKDILIEGYQKFKNDVYQVWGIDGFIIIVPPKYVEELNALGTDALDVHAASQTRIIGEYPWLRIADHLLFHSVQVDLTRHTGKLIPGIRKEIEHAQQLYFPQGHEWTPVTLWPPLLKTMALIVSYMTVGPGLSRDEAWLSTMVGFLDDLFAGAWELKSYPIVLRPIVARGFVPGIRRVWKRQADARNMLLPIIKQRRAAATEAQRRGEKDWVRPNDLLQWLMDNAAKSSPPKSDEFVAEMCLVVGFGALHAATITLVNAVFDLAARPEYIDIIRAEYREAAQQALNTGAKEAQVLNGLGKLDSFLKESQRLNPTTLTAFSRQVLKPVALSNGVQFPVGTHVLVPSSMVSLDSAIYPDPRTFNGLRYHNIRKNAETTASNRHQFTSTSPEQLHFGFGRQACPGRFFGSTAIKCIILHLLQEYDIKLTDVKEGRPENSIKGAMIFPSETAQISFKKLEKERII